MSDHLEVQGKTGGRRVDRDRQSQGNPQPVDMVVIINATQA